VNLRAGRLPIGECSDIIMTISANVPRVIVRGTGSALPERVVTNRDFEATLDTSDEWIYTRTGIRSRHFAGPTDSSATLAIKAARRALEAAALEPGDIDLVVCGTVTPERTTPPNAAVVQATLGCRPVPAFDLAAACSGFIFALDVARKFFYDGKVRHALVIGAEVLSRIQDYKNRATCILFGDGAGAVVLSAAPSGARGILHTSLTADGTHGDLIELPTIAHGGEGFGSPAPRVVPYLTMQGRETYRFAVRTMVDTLCEALNACQLTFDDVAAIIPHQSNTRVFEVVAKELGLPLDKFIVNIDHVGNTAAASVPIALDEAVRSGRIVEGDVVAMVAFGGGLTWSSAVVRW
jgi:3-oxoacyl-[acyl-carrier-protein] synthase-3